MAGSLLYYITDRSAFTGDERARRRKLLDKIAQAARCSVDYIQLREKDLQARALEWLARDAMQIIRNLRAEKPTLQTALLINSRIDLAIAVGADGIHLRSNDISPEDARTIWRQAHKCGAGTLARENSPQDPLISIACHSQQEVARAVNARANFAVFAPVFEKKDLPGSRPAGLETLREACRYRIPVIALGGITAQNAKSCLEAGAAGIAGIRLFQDNDIAEMIRQL
jgi:thiamine-phosphate pyrophosphorylase